MRLDIRKLPRKERRLAQKYIEQENKKYMEKLAELPKEEWLESARRSSTPIIKVWRSSKFLVQVYDESKKYGDIIRLSVCRTTIKNSGDWDEDITWEELQQIKNEAGYRDCDAVEIYPKG